MNLAVFASALVVAGSDPAQTAPAASGPPAAAPAPAPAQPPAADPSIDSILQGLSGPDQTTDSDEEAGANSSPGPTPYDRLDVKTYDRAVRETADAARARSGRLDGGWTLAGADGRALYRFQFLDHGTGSTEGAWRDLNGGGGLKGSGVLSLVDYDGGRLVLRFYETGPEDPVVVTVAPSPTGAWNGELVRKGASTPVRLKRE
jgi:hypothetical protein